jgi:hypothetical protein
MPDCCACRKILVNRTTGTVPAPINRVGGLEADPPDVGRQPVWLPLDRLDRLVAVLLVDLHRQGRGDAHAPPARRMAHFDRRCFLVAASGMRQYLRVAVIEVSEESLRLIAGDEVLKRAMT